MKNFIYADNAATTQLDIRAFEAMKPYLFEEYGNASQPYNFARKSKAALTEARAVIANCINAAPEEIYFTSGGTESDNWVIKNSVLSASDRREIITSSFEHHAILNSCKYIERMKYPVLYLQPNSEGTITIDNLSNALSRNTQLVSIMLANNEIGSIQPIKEMCKVAHANDVLFHTDAVQAVGHINIDVKDLGIDMLSASAHKFNGPKGIGFLYIREGVELLPYINGGEQENGHRAGTENIAAIVGMATALKLNCEALKNNQSHIISLENQLLSQLSYYGIEYIRNGGKNILPGLLSLSFAEIDGEMLLHRLDLMGICVSTGSACDSKNTAISHVLKAIRLDEQLAKGTIRISLGKNNTKEEINCIANSLKKIILN